ncbi:MAG: hypothetical protein JW774_12410 [Candidatus Aureabacteria bacterium]|nr:hypothetical protein [Candidatus Auribacterota bacterium]
MKNFFIRPTPGLFLILGGLLSVIFAFPKEPLFLISLFFGKRLSLNPVHLHQLDFIRNQLWWLGFFLFFSGIVWIRFGKKITGLFAEGLRSFSPVHKGPLWLFWVSFTALFFEIIFIRWISSEVRIFSFFKNVTLIAAYLGLGLGCLISNKPKRLEILFIPFTAFFLLFIGFGSDTYLRIISFSGATLFRSELQVWGHTFNANWVPLCFFIFYGSLAFLFMMQILIFIPLGHLVGRGFQGIPRIKAYSVNIAGSLSGICLYNVLTCFSTPPALWFLAGIIPICWILRDRKKELLISTGLFVLGLGALYDTAFPKIWSPYNRISVTDSYLWKTPSGISRTYPQIPSDMTDSKGHEGEWVNIGKRLDVNDLYYMDITDFSERFLSRYPGFYENIPFYSYNVPFTLFHPEKVCVVGSGGGNDVAAALRGGAKKVTAVEIDPKIAETGKRYHPERPYQDPRVSLVIDDARHFFNNTAEKFDCLIFGLLDSHSLFSTFSSVRLDNYVYTLESFQKVKELLTPGGSVVCTFAVQQPWLRERFYRMFQKVFGTDPVILSTTRGLTFITGMKESYQELVRKKGGVPCPNVTEVENVPPATDDWPFMYQKDRALPLSFIIGLVIMIVLGTGSAFFFLPKGERSLAGYGQYFWFGVSFLLIETKSISQLALVWGSTWKVTALVIGIILILILLANIYVIKARIRQTRWYYFFLLSGVLFTYFYPFRFISMNHVWAYVLPTFILLFPLFFAGIIFAAVFQNEKKPETALGWNLIGGVVGGFLEYFSVLSGFKFLAIIAFLGYVLSWISQQKQRG